MQETVDFLCDHPAIRAVSFVGSGAVGRRSPSPRPPYRPVTSPAVLRSRPLLSSTPGPPGEATRAGPSSRRRSPSGRPAGDGPVVGPGPAAGRRWLPGSLWRVVARVSLVSLSLYTHTHTHTMVRHVYGRATAAGKRCQCNMGAKNHAVVLPDANREQVTGIL